LLFLLLEALVLQQLLDLALAEGIQLDGVQLGLVVVEDDPGISSNVFNLQIFVVSRLVIQKATNLRKSVQLSPAAGFDDGPGGIDLFFFLFFFGVLIIGVVLAIFEMGIVLGQSQTKPEMDSAVGTPWSAAKPYTTRL